jgi:hypothetical protein
MPPGAGEKENEKGGKRKRGCGRPFCLVTTLVVRLREALSRLGE